MNNVYLNWLLLIGVGAVAALFVSARIVFIFSGVCFGIAIATFAAAIVQRSESLQMSSGVALMIIPMVGALVGGGAMLTGEIREGLAKRKKKLEGRKASPGA